MRRCTHRDEGMTLVELSVAMLLAAIIGGVMVMWLGTVARTEGYEASVEAALDELTTAKARLVRELRFAESLDAASTDHAVTVWIDLNEDEVQQAGTGENVTWTIRSDGRLVRESDDAPGVEAIQATLLVYDAAAGPGTSRFSYDLVNSVVTIELAADVDSSSLPAPTNIQTQVHLRNS